VRYIGKAKNSAKRFAQHMREKRRRTPFYDWVAKMRAEGLNPSFRVAIVCTDADWRECETKAIADAKEAGVRLLNIALGGDQPHCPVEVRAENGRKVAKIRAANPRAAFIFNAKRVLGTAIRQGYVSEATRAKMRLAAQRNPAMFGVWANV
jgi:hypothetical protein